MTQIWMNASSEQFPSSDLLRQMAEAAEAGFDAVGTSDHFQPWWPEGQSGNAWVVLGAALQATNDVPMGTGVTAPLFRYHPVLVAQAFMTLEELFPGRVYLGVGSGEALNEVPFGFEWPSTGEQIRRLDEALEIITRLWSGETLDFEGEHYTTHKAHLYTRAASRPKLHVSAFGPQAAGVAGRWGDGVWTLGDPENVPEGVDAYREAATKAGREPGEIILQSGFSWAESDEAAMENARVWKATAPPEYYTEDWHDPQSMQEHAHANVSDEEFTTSNAISPDPERHVEKIVELAGLGATVVCLQNFSGADPHDAIETYKKDVLPRAREQL